MFHVGVDQIIRRCVPEEKQVHILSICHSSLCGGNFASRKTRVKVLQSGFYWLTLFKDAIKYCNECLMCQSVLNISKRDEMSLQIIVEVEIFYVGDRLYGTISTLGGKIVYFCSGGLCVQMGRGNTDEDKRSLSG